MLFIVPYFKTRSDSSAQNSFEDGLSQQDKQKDQKKTEKKPFLNSKIKKLYITKSPQTKAQGGSVESQQVQKSNDQELNQLILHSAEMQTPQEASPKNSLQQEIQTRIFNSNSLTKRKLEALQENQAPQVQLTNQQHQTPQSNLSELVQTRTSSVNLSKQGSGVSNILNSKDAKPKQNDKFKMVQFKVISRIEGIQQSPQSSQEVVDSLTKRDGNSRIRIKKDQQVVEVQSCIGRGGFFTVYKGQWQDIDVAVKMIELTSGKRKFVQLLKQHLVFDTVITNTLKHENVIESYGYNLREKQNKDSSKTKLVCCIVQEICDLGSLASMLKKKILCSNNSVIPNMQRVLQIGLDISNGMEHIHQHNLIHGDLSSNNILLKSKADSMGFTCKITDFGLSVRLNELNNEDLKQQQKQIGTPFYIAPEVSQDYFLSLEADVYSFGVLLWELYHGRVVYHAVPNNTNKFVHDQKFPFFPQTCPLPFALLCSICLNKNREKRPKFKEIRETLEILMGCVQKEHFLNPIQNWKINGDTLEKIQGDINNISIEDIQNICKESEKIMSQYLSYNAKINNGATYSSSQLSQSMGSSNQQYDYSSQDFLQDTLRSSQDDCGKLQRQQINQQQQKQNLLQLQKNISIPKAISYRNQQGYQYGQAWRNLPDVEEEQSRNSQLASRASRDTDISQYCNQNKFQFLQAEQQKMNEVQNLGGQSQLLNIKDEESDRRQKDLKEQIQAKLQSNSKVDQPQPPISRSRSSNNSSLSNIIPQIQKIVQSGRKSNDTEGANLQMQFAPQVEQVQINQSKLKDEDSDSNQRMSTYNQSISLNKMSTQKGSIKYPTISFKDQLETTKESTSNIDIVQSQQLNDPTRQLFFKNQELLGYQTSSNSQSTSQGKKIKSSDFNLQNIFQNIMTGRTSPLYSDTRSSLAQKANNTPQKAGDYNGGWQSMRPNTDIEFRDHNTINPQVQLQTPQLTQKLNWNQQDSKQVPQYNHKPFGINQLYHLQQQGNEQNSYSEQLHPNQIGNQSSKQPSQSKTSQDALLQSEEFYFDPLDTPSQSYNQNQGDQEIAQMQGSFKADYNINYILQNSKSHTKNKSWLSDTSTSDATTTPLVASRYIEDKIRFDAEQSYKSLQQLKQSEGLQKEFLQQPSQHQKLFNLNMESKLKSHETPDSEFHTPRARTVNSEEFKQLGGQQGDMAQSQELISKQNSLRSFYSIKQSMDQIIQEPNYDNITKIYPDDKLQRLKTDFLRNTWTFTVDTQSEPQFQSQLQRSLSFQSYQQIKLMDDRYQNFMKCSPQFEPIQGHIEVNLLYTRLCQTQVRTTLSKQMRSFGDSSKTRYSKSYQDSSIDYSNTSLQQSSFQQSKGPSFVRNLSSDDLTQHRLSSMQTPWNTDVQKGPIHRLEYGWMPQHTNNQDINTDTQADQRQNKQQGQGEQQQQVLEGLGDTTGKQVSKKFDTKYNNQMFVEKQDNAQQNTETPQDPKQRGLLLQNFSPRQETLSSYLNQLDNVAQPSPIIASQAIFGDNENVNLKFDDPQTEDRTKTSQKVNFISRPSYTKNLSQSPFNLSEVQSGEQAPTIDSRKKDKLKYSGSTIFSDEERNESQQDDNGSLEESECVYDTTYQTPNPVFNSSKQQDPNQFQYQNQVQQQTQLQQRQTQLFRGQQNSGKIDDLKVSPSNELPEVSPRPGSFQEALRTAIGKVSTPGMTSPILDTCRTDISNQILSNKSSLGDTKARSSKFQYSSGDQVSRFQSSSGDQVSKFQYSSGDQTQDNKVQGQFGHQQINNKVQPSIQGKSLPIRAADIVNDRIINPLQQQAKKPVAEKQPSNQSQFLRAPPQNLGSQDQNKAPDNNFARQSQAQIPQQGPQNMLNQSNLDKAATIFNVQNEIQPDTLFRSDSIRLMGFRNPQLLMDQQNQLQFLGRKLKYQNVNNNQYFNSCSQLSPTKLNDKRCNRLNRTEMNLDYVFNDMSQNSKLDRSSESNYLNTDNQKRNNYYINPTYYSNHSLSHTHSNFLNDFSSNQQTQHQSEQNFLTKTTSSLPQVRAPEQLLAHQKHQFKQDISKLQKVKQQIQQSQQSSWSISDLMGTNYLGNMSETNGGERIDTTSKSVPSVLPGPQKGQQIEDTQHKISKQEQYLQNMAKWMTMQESKLVQLRKDQSHRLQKFEENQKQGWAGIHKYLLENGEQDVHKVLDTKSLLQKDNAKLDNLLKMNTDGVKATEHNRKIVEQQLQQIQANSNFRQFNFLAEPSGSITPPRTPDTPNNSKINYSAFYNSARNNLLNNGYKQSRQQYLHQMQTQLYRQLQWQRDQLRYQSEQLQEYQAILTQNQEQQQKCNQALRQGKGNPKLEKEQTNSLQFLKQQEATLQSMIFQQLQMQQLQYQQQQVQESLLQQHIRLQQKTIVTEHAIQNMPNIERHVKDGQDHENVFKNLQEFNKSQHFNLGLKQAQSSKNSLEFDSKPTSGIPQSIQNKYNGNLSDNESNTMRLPYNLSTFRDNLDEGRTRKSFDGNLNKIWQSQQDSFHKSSLYSSESKSFYQRNFQLSNQYARSPEEYQHIIEQFKIRHTLQQLQIQNQSQAYQNQIADLTASYKSLLHQQQKNQANQSKSNNQQECSQINSERQAQNTQIPSQFSNISNTRGNKQNLGQERNKEGQTNKMEDALNSIKGYRDKLNSTHNSFEEKQKKEKRDSNDSDASVTLSSLHSLIQKTHQQFVVNISNSTITSQEIKAGRLSQMQELANENQSNLQSTSNVQSSNLQTNKASTSITNSEKTQSKAPKEHNQLAVVKKNKQSFLKYKQGAPLKQQNEQRSNDRRSVQQSIVDKEVAQSSDNIEKQKSKESKPSSKDDKIVFKENKVQSKENKPLQQPQPTPKITKNQPNVDGSSRKKLNQKHNNLDFSMNSMEMPSEKTSFWKRLEGRSKVNKLRQSFMATSQNPHKFREGHSLDYGNLNRTQNMDDTQATAPDFSYQQENSARFSKIKLPDISCTGHSQRGFKILFRSRNKIFNNNNK